MSQLLPLLPSKPSPSPDPGGTSSGRFAERLQSELHAHSVQTLQINVGKRCNQACKHCHVDAGPNRTEMMSDATVDAVVRVLGEQRFTTLDITGGAPELHERFRSIVVAARELGIHVIVRHNLTVMFEPGHDDLPEFFAANDVEIVSSLPHFSESATDRQRGGGVFKESILALKRLNDVGYGLGDP